MKKKEYVKICPRCGSVKIEGKITILTALGVPPITKCNSCQYQGHIFPEIKIENILKFQEEIEKSKK